jgi:hypothetical protein
MEQRETKRIGHEIKKLFGTKIFSILMDFKNKRHSNPEDVARYETLIEMYENMDKDFVKRVIEKYENKTGVMLSDALRRGVMFKKYIHDPRYNNLDTSIENNVDVVNCEKLSEMVDYLIEFIRDKMSEDDKRDLMYWAGINVDCDSAQDFIA